MASGRQIRLLLVDDHPVFREGLSTVIGSESDLKVVGVAGSAEEAIDQHRLLQPDLTIMDQRLPGASGTEALISIRKEFPRARVMMIAAHKGDIEVQKAVKAGAVGYVLKSAPRRELLGVIRSAALGRRHISPEVSEALSEYLGYEELSLREITVLEHIRDGHRNKSIAELLGIAEGTVNFHIRNIVAKLGANDRAHAVTIGFRRGLLRL